MWLSLSITVRYRSLHAQFLVFCSPQFVVFRDTSSALLHALLHVVMALFYHVYDVVCSPLVEWLVERLGDSCSVLLCLLVSIIVRGFLSVLLSTLGSPAASVKALP